MASTTFYTLLTAYGERAFAKALAEQTHVNIRAVAIGDAQGKFSVPNRLQTALINEVYRTAPSSIRANQHDKSQVIIEQDIPVEIGGFYIREIGLYDAQDKLIAVGNYPETYKTVLKEGSGQILLIRVVIQVYSTEAVELKFDNSTVYVTQAQHHPQSINATSKNHTSDQGHSHEIAKANIQQAGIVKLNSATNSESEIDAATPKAIKIVADKLDESAIATNYNPHRHYHAGQILWHEGNWYECYHPDGCKGINPSEPTNRPIGWQITDITRPYYWLKIGNTLSLPEIGVPLPLPSLNLREGIIKYRNDTPLHKDKFWRLAEAYPNLVNGNFLTITDLRGEFIRGLDDGRGVDSNRTLLSQQNDAIRNIMGTFTLGVHSSGRAWFSGANYPAPSTHDMAINNAILAPSNPVGFDASRVVPTANENRPRNIAFLYGTRF